MEQKASLLCSQELTEGNIHFLMVSLNILKRMEHFLPLILVCILVASAYKIANIGPWKNIHGRVVGKVQTKNSCFLSNVNFLY